MVFFPNWNQILRKAGHVELNEINLNRAPAAADPPPIPDFHVQDFK